MFKKFNYLLLAIFMCSAIAFTTGCDVSDDDPASIVGYWEAAWDGFEVFSDNTFKYYYDTSRNVGYEGTIEAESSDLTDTEGTLVVHLSGDGVYIDNYYGGGWALDYTYMVDGYYTVIVWQELGDTTCKEAGPYKDGTSESQAVKANAISAITEANGYFGMTGDYTRQ